MRIKEFIVIFILAFLLCNSNNILVGDNITLDENIEAPLNMNPDIKNSHHDFSGKGWNLDHKYCAPCHAPHNANKEVPNSPLWNHELSSASYMVYTSPSINASIGQPTGKSKLCLSCHDGTVAIDSYGGNHGTDPMTSTQGGYISTDLRNNHPISFDYNSALATADGKLYDPSTTPSGLGGTIAEDLLDNGSMECTSCHDVHVERNTQGCSGCHFVHGMTTRSLSIRIDNSGSAFCLTCHKK